VTRDEIHARFEAQRGATFSLAWTIDCLERDGKLPPGLAKLLAPELAAFRAAAKGVREATDAMLAADVARRAA